MWREVRRALLEYVARFNRAQVPMLAASLAYYATFSLVPLVLLGIAGFGFALERNPELERGVLDFLDDSLRTAIPVDDGLLRSTLNVVREGVLERLQVNAGISGLIGLVALVWAASGFFHVLQSALTLAVPGARTRSVIVQRALAVVSILTLGPLLLLLMLGGVVASAVSSLPVFEPVAAYGTSLLPAAGAGLLFALAYRFLPAHSPGWRAALLAAVPTALAWQLARVALGVFTPRAAYEATYGPLTSVLLLLAWLYLSMHLLLMGGVLAGLIESREREARRSDAPAADPV